jgi:hypothetical protein
MKVKEKTLDHLENVTGKLVLWKNGKLNVLSKHRRAVEGRDRMLEIPVGNIEYMEVLTFQRTHLRSAGRGTDFSGAYNYSKSSDREKWPLVILGALRRGGRGGQTLALSI